MKRILFTCIRRDTLKNIRHLARKKGISVGNCVELLLRQYIGQCDPSVEQKLQIAKDIATEGRVRNAMAATECLLENAVLDETDRAYLLQEEAGV